MALSFNDRIWIGDSRTVAEARDAFRNGSKTLLEFLSVLYSFRYRRRYANELWDYRGGCYKLGQNFPGSDPSKIGLPELANQADVLSSLLLWYRSQAADYSWRYSRQAKVVAEAGLMFCTADTPRHTRALLRLTLAEISLSSRMRMQALDCIDTAAEAAPLIEDVNQKARVYRKIGLLLRTAGEWREGMRWGVSACRLPGIARGVAIKNYAALLRGHP